MQWGYFLLKFCNISKKISLTKPERKKKSALSNIFLVVNYYYIWKNVKSSKLKEEIGDDLEILNSWVEEQKEIYRKTWNKALEYILDEEFKGKAKDRIKARIMGGKQNAIIKARFEGVNHEIEELFATQKHFFIADEELRNQMRQETKERIIPLYKQFIEKYSSVNFTKNIGKYLRYSPETLEGMLNQFFEGIMCPFPLKISSIKLCLRSICKIISSRKVNQCHSRTYQYPLEELNPSNFVYLYNNRSLMPLTN